jgi:hypothetical protein
VNPSHSTTLRKRIVELAFFFFLLSVAPVLYAAAEIEQKNLRRAPITRVVTIRRRERALYRRYGALSPQFTFDFSMVQ